MSSFETAAEAQTFVRNIVDVPTSERQLAIGDGLQFHAFPEELNEDSFTNVYNISYRKNNAAPVIHVHDRLTSIYDYVRSHNVDVATGGGFFYLTDITTSLPRQLALNLAVAEGRIRNLPVVDREAVLSDGHNISAQPLHSLGMLSINHHELSWSGSLTTHETDVKIFANGNAVITHDHNEATGSVRVLDEQSRFTSLIENGDTVDIGFIAQENGSFKGAGTSSEGGLDIFGHDFVVRCHERHLADATELKVHTIGSVAVDALRGGLSVGPMLEQQDFENHPINKDAALGGKPPFLERPLARTVLYETEDEMLHIRLFDGRPGSETFPGVTPSEALNSIQAEGEIAWGCFLDPGQTAKLCVRISDEVESLGNRHYLRWPTKSGEKYLWVPKIGRPTASAITVK